MPTTVAMRKRRTATEWRHLIARAEQSELTIAAFCRAEGITTASFYTWRKRLHAEVCPEVVSTGEEPPDFLDLGALGTSPAQAEGWDIELDLGGGAILRLRRR